MVEAVSILHDLRRGKYEASLVTTFNVYFPFYEDVLLRHFLSAGCRHNLLLMDARQCGAALQASSTRPRFAGKAYRLLPIKAAQAFHPKLLFLIGKSRGQLFVGSHNATLAGFSHNREITNRFEFSGEKDEQALAAIQAAWEFVKAWANNLPEPLQSSISEIEGFAGWLKGSVSSSLDTSFMGTMPKGAALWDRVRQKLPGDVKRVTVVGPYFDSDLQFLKRLAAEFASAELVVGVDSHTVSISEEAGRTFTNAKFVDTESLREGIGYLHAKAILFECQDGQEALITGSANPSGPAWLNPPALRNAEAVILRITTNKNSVAKVLGIKGLAKQPRVSQDAWRAMIKRPNDRDTSHGHLPVIAIATDDGFEIDTQSFNLTQTEEARILDANSDLLGLCTGVATPNDVLYFAVADDHVRMNASLLELRSEDRLPVFAIVHHEKELSESALTSRQRELKTALASLEGGTPMLEELMRVVEKVIFDDVTEASLEVVRKATTGEEATAEEPTAQASYRIPLKDIKRRKKNKPASISAGDLGLLLDALIHRLGVGLQAEVHSSAGYARSEEDLRDSEDEELVNTQAIDGEALVRTCHRKVRKMLRRMTRQLENAAESKARTLTVIAQLAAVLALIQRLNELDCRAATWIPQGQQLVPAEARLDFFLDVTRLLYSEQSGIMKSALVVLNGEACKEVSIIRGLLLVAASGVDLQGKKTKGSDDLDLMQSNLIVLSRLMLMTADIIQDDDAYEHAQTAIPRLAPELRRNYSGLTWLNDLMRWVEGIEAIKKDSRRVPTLGQRPEAGDIVIHVKSSQLYIVKEVPHPNVKVIDVDSPEEQKMFREGYVSVIKFPH
ncbi:MAG TPA: hypothetical protein VJ464_10050 [Blastocatellia bacterium]|nr:hypothetical protein [Blastocatellia bacterium]